MSTAKMSSGVAAIDRAQELRMRSRTQVALLATALTACGARFGAGADPASIVLDIE